MTHPLPSAVAVVERGRRAGLHLGAQLYVSRHGRSLVDDAFGDDRPGVPMATDTVLPWMSSGKPVTAVAVAQQWEAGRLGLDDPVVTHVPEFAAHGKEGITIRHLLTHTAGFRVLRTGWPESTWEETIATLAAARPEPNWTPGERAGYHLQSSWFVLGEIVRRLDGRPFDRYVREAVFEPAGMTSCWIGMPPEALAELGARLGTFWNTARHPPAEHPRDEFRLTRPAPGGNAHGPIHELGRLYEVLLGGGAAPGGGRLLRPQTVEAMTSHQRVGMFDRTFRRVMDWGLGLIPNSAPREGADLPYHYGRHASRRTWGHSGYRSSTAFADAEHGLVVAAVFNGTPSEAAAAERMTDVLEAIYEDLGLARTEPPDDATDEG